MDKSLRDYFLKVDKDVVIDTNGEISANLLRKSFKFSSLVQVSGTVLLRYRIETSIILEVLIYIVRNSPWKSRTKCS